MLFIFYGSPSKLKLYICTKAAIRTGFHIADQSGVAILRAYKKSWTVLRHGVTGLAFPRRLPHSMKKMKTNPPDVHTFSSSPDPGAKPYAARLMVQGVG